MDLPAPQLEEQADRFAALLGIKKPNPTDVFFLVVGRTGSGKSTFISQCTGKNVNIGHGLFSCTNTLDVFEMHLNGRRIFLCDTPGFNDTNRPDIEVLETIASCLSVSYANKVRIHGIIMLHPISDNRIGGSSLRNIDMLRAMIGTARYDNLAIVTTMWPCVCKAEDDERLEARYNELVIDDRFFGDMIGKGAEIFRLHDTGSMSGHDLATGRWGPRNIVAHLVHRADKHPLDGLLLQKEMVDQGKSLGRTAAGLLLAGDINRTQNFHQERLREVDEAGKEVGVALNQLSHLMSTRKRALEELSKLKSANEALEKNLFTMHLQGQRQWKDFLSRQLRQMERDHHQKLLGSVQQPSTLDVSLRDNEKGDSMQLIREEVSQIRRVQEKVKGYKGHIVNGATNGVAASMTASILAGKQGWRQTGCSCFRGCTALTIFR
ncbi:P-loop containing nucleoside triphosphate hydrolase protein [Stachybotrys elegans]|uniref:P-loop containing nucleoside triphosphate hydrolase protein n=1 Tax=Stachybotrys elegans TaxID=80388 RepID=A0A8K0SS74_9HYPO|nr:P-loop containing nucleoside triphosphate hydrolase protein [Stachybotrys elegans]